MLVFSMTMTFAGTFGVPRRHWDISFAQAPFDVQFNPAVDLLLGFMALGGLVAAVGGAIYIVVTVWSVFFGRPLEAGARAAAGVPPGIATPPRHGPDADRINQELHAPARGLWGPAPGTLALVGVFLLAFVIYYFVNWKLLSFVWKVG
jgi:cytochrome c oxidase subunit 1